MSVECVPGGSVEYVPSGGVECVQSGMLNMYLWSLLYVSAQWICWICIVWKNVECVPSGDVDCGYLVEMLRRVPGGGMLDLH